MLLQNNAPGTTCPAMHPTFLQQSTLPPQYLTNAYPHQQQQQPNSLYPPRPPIFNGPSPISPTALHWLQVNGARIMSDNRLLTTPATITSSSTSSIIQQQQEQKPTLQFDENASNVNINNNYMKREQIFVSNSF
ncbi:unnamed protein product [Didymodactylos carnosus]|uniref:Uncharacterized protein n=1 Tax=Didymodactylos carnosus TaxID=1234261 RepID=A0A815IEH6_9BILA|nr:unnamed protein product [Didymodactylos carnosus]CAF1362670.1 unnamed protein product [Didymodactylos carnosus]CAF3834505.1 unnamed protein product [Didymodactylos carnosus]CAF4242619.1 unnamed protein product [Didymodactylos carnosus]